MCRPYDLSLILTMYLKLGVLYCARMYVHLHKLITVKTPWLHADKTVVIGD